MSSVKVSALTEITSTTGSEELLINDGGTSKKIQVSNLPDTDTTYSNFAGTTAGLVPTSTTDDDTKFLRADGTWVVPTDNDTTYSTVTTSVDGLAPTLPATHGSKFLRGDATWVVPTDTDTTYTAGDGLDLSTTQFSLDLKASGGLKITSTELEVDFGTTATTAAQGNHTHSGYDAAGTAVAMAIALGG
jgi:hypothetical protein